MEPTKMIGPYRLLQLLGRGGMGVVHLAEHASTGQRVALKTVTVPQESYVQSLRREVRTLQRLRHPGIVPIVEEGLEQGVPWYAMEYVEGVSFRRWLKLLGNPAKTVRLGLTTEVQPSPGWDEAAARPTLRQTEIPATLAWWTQTVGVETRPLEEAGELSIQGEEPPPELLLKGLSILRKICPALAFLHGEGFVHLDLKPDNILVRPDGRPIIVDFGLATQLYGEQSRDSLDLVWGLVGTVAYMSPELIRQSLVDARADLYALGCVLFELGAGKPPFTGTPSSILHQHLSEEPVFPASFEPGLRRLVGRLLAKEPRDRLGYADDLATELGKLGAEADAVVGPRARPFLYRPSFRGRQKEIHGLRSALETLFGGRGGVRWVLGPSGIGKTRLVLEIGREAASCGTTVLAGESVPHVPEVSTSPLFQVLRRPLQQVAELGRIRSFMNQEPPVFGPESKVLLAYEPALERLLEGHPDPPDLAPDAAKARLFRVLGQVFAGLAAWAPVLLILDNLQEADELSLEFLVDWVPRLREANVPLLLLASCRSEELSSRPALARLCREEPGELLEIEALDKDAVASMMIEMLALPKSSRRLAAFLHQHSEGNPLFVAEYLKTAVDLGLLWRDEEGHWQVAESSAQVATESDYESLPLPLSLRELVESRLLRLPEAARALAEAVAILGREAPWSLVECLQPGLDGLEELLLRQILERSRAKSGEALLRFAHDKLREIAYQGIDPARRRSLHLVAAEAMERLQPELRPWAQLAGHWEQAGELAKAAEAYWIAARKALDRYGLDECERLLRAHLRLVPEGLEARRLLIVNVLMVQGRKEEAMREQNQALEIARGLGDVAAEAEGLRQLGAIWMESGHPQEAMRLYLDALSLAREVGARMTEARALNNVGVLRMHSGESEGARHALLAALELYSELGGVREQGILWVNLAVLSHEQGNLEEAQPLYLRALERFRETADRIHEGVALLNLGELEKARGHRDPARRYFEEALILQRETGYRRGEGFILSQLAGLSLEEGRLPEARSLYEEAIGILREARDRHHQSLALRALARLARLCGAGMEARARAQEALDIQRELGFRGDAALTLCELAFQDLAEGASVDELQAQAHEIADQLGVQPESELRKALTSLARASRSSPDALHQGELRAELPPQLRQALGLP